MKQDQGQKDVVDPLVDMKFKVSIRGWKDNAQEAGVLSCQSTPPFNR